MEVTEAIKVSEGAEVNEAAQVSEAKKIFNKWVIQVQVQIQDLII